MPLKNDHVLLSMNIQAIESVPRISRTLMDKWVLEYKQTTQIYCISIHHDKPFNHVEFYIGQRECFIMFRIVCNFCLGIFGRGI